MFETSNKHNKIGLKRLNSCISKIGKLHRIKVLKKDQF